MFLLLSVGPWGDAGDVIIALLPIALLLFFVLKKEPIDAEVSLPLSAFILWLLRHAYFGGDPKTTDAAVVQGVLNSATPTSVILGAVVLLATWRETGILDWMIAVMKKLSHGNPIAEVMIIGWCFVAMVEGAAGSGTPNALAAPVLYSLGHDPFAAACLCLVNDGMFTSFGGVGLSMFFGMKNTHVFEHDNLLVETALKITIINAFCATFVPVMALCITVPWRIVKNSLIFVYLSIASVIVPYIALGTFSYNFPSLLGGAIGLVITMFLSYKGVGLGDCKHRDLKICNESQKPDGADYEKPLLEDPDQNYVDELKSGDHLSIEEENRLRQATASFEIHDDKGDTKSSMGESVEVDLRLWTIFMNTMPIWSTVLLLVITHVPQIGLAEHLRAETPRAEASLRALGTLGITPGLNLQLRNIFHTEETFAFQMLFVPWFLPFIVVSAITLVLYRSSLSASMKWYDPFVEGLLRTKRPAIALAGATVLAELLQSPVLPPDEATSPAAIIGVVLSDAFKAGWIAISVAIGALGAFFAGSTTVSNLTFGTVQETAANNLHVSATSVLALQGVGGNMGNMIALANIVLLRAIMGDSLGHVPEGVFVKKTLSVMLPYLLGATVIGFVLVYGIR